jgi:putative transcriptional regulator
LSEIGVRALREKLGLSQSEFADRYQIALRTLQQWEQGRSVPDGPARAYLKVIARSPGAVQRALNQMKRPVT